MQSKYMLENTRGKKRDSRIGLAMGLAYAVRDLSMGLSYKDVWKMMCDIRVGFEKMLF